MRTLTFLILSFLICPVFGQSSKTIRTYSIGKKTETVIKYRKGSEVSRFVEEVELYNKEGNWVEKLVYSSDGELKEHGKRRFEKGEVVDELTIDANGSGAKKAKPPSYEHFLYTYDKGEVVLKKQINEDGDVLAQTTYTYDKLGDLVEKIFKDGLGEVIKRETIEYNDKGLKTAEKLFDSSGKILKEKIFVYE